VSSPRESRTVILKTRFIIKKNKKIVQKRRENMKQSLIYGFLLIILGMNSFALDTLYNQSDVIVLTQDIPQSHGKFFAVFYKSDSPDYCDSIKKEEIQLTEDIVMEKMYLFAVYGINDNGDTIKAYVETGTRSQEIGNLKILLEKCKQENQKITVWYTGHEADPKILWIQTQSQEAIKFFTRDHQETNKFDIRWCVRDG
jgi:hypothetical protein